MRWLTSKIRPSPARKRRGAKAARSARASRSSRGRLRRPGALVQRELALKGAVALAGLLCLATVIGLVGSGWAGRKLDRLAEGLGRASAAVGLSVDEVFVEGRQRTRPGQLLAAIEVTRGDPILGFDPQAARARVEALPWISRVTVERRLPSVVYLRIEERTPIALWQEGGAVAVIDEAGVAIPGARPQDFAGLTLVVGPDAPAHAAELLRLLESEPELRQRVVAAVRVGGRRWNLRFLGGTDVRLPETGAAQAWAQFARIERQHGVLQRDVDSIDLRLPDRLVVHTAPDEDPPAVKADGKNT